MLAAKIQKEQIGCLRARFAFPALRIQPRVLGCRDNLAPLSPGTLEGGNNVLIKEKLLLLGDWRRIHTRENTLCSVFASNLIRGHYQKAPLVSQYTEIVCLQSERVKLRVSSRRFDSPLWPPALFLPFSWLALTHPTTTTPLWKLTHHCSRRRKKQHAT